MEAILGLLIMMFIISKFAKSSLSGKLMGEFAGMLLSTPMWGYKIIKGISRSDTYGSAKWMPWLKLQKTLNTKNDGFTIGKKSISAKESVNHAIAIAPSGGGKTTAILIPSLINLAIYLKSFLVTDPSGEIVRIVGKFLKKCGYEVRIINPNNPSASFKYNPLSRIHNDSDIHKLAQIIVSSALKESLHSDPYWRNAAIHFLSILIRILINEPINKRTLHELKLMVEKMGSSSRTQIDALAAKHLSGHHFEAYLSLVQQATSSPKTFLSIVSTARAALSHLHSNVAAITMEDTIKFEDLRKKKVAIFLCIPEHEAPHYEFFSNVFYQQVFDFCAQMPQPNQEFRDIFLLLDEFANISIPNMTEVITTIRKRNVGCLLVIQSISQLFSKYQQGAEIILGNTKTKFILPGLDIMSANYIEKMIGRTTIKDRENPFNIFSNTHEVGRELIQANEIRGLKKGTALFLFGNEQPAKIDVVPYYKNKRIMRMLK